MFVGLIVGFLILWFIVVFVIGLFVEWNWVWFNFVFVFVIIFVSSVVIMYGIGNVWLSYFVFMSYFKVIIVVGFFLLGDLFKLVLVVLVVVMVKCSYFIIWVCLVV